MLNLQTLEDMYEYIETSLGSPVIQIEISVKHLNLAIDKAIKFYTEKGGIGSTSQKVLRVTVTDPDNIKLPDEIMNVSKVYTGSNSAFDTGILFDHYSLYGTYPCGTYTIGYNLIGYEIFAQYRTMIENHFMKPQLMTFDPGTKQLLLTPKPAVGDEIIFIADARLPDYDPAYLNNQFIMDYAVAWSNYYWQFILAKYGDRGLSGGITVNARLEDAKAEIERLEEQFRVEYSESPYISVG